MTSKAQQSQERRRREAASLAENLKRRKAQAYGRKATARESELETAADGGASTLERRAKGERG